MKTNLKSNEPTILDRARAAGCYLNERRNGRTGQVPKDMEMAAFMAIFHPEIKGQRLKSLMPEPE